MRLPFPYILRIHWAQQTGKQINIQWGFREEKTENCVPPMRPRPNPTPQPAPKPKAGPNFPRCFDLTAGSFHNRPLPPFPSPPPFISPAVLLYVRRWVLSSSLTWVLKFSKSLGQSSPAQNYILCSTGLNPPPPFPCLRRLVLKRGMRTCGLGRISPYIELRPLNWAHI